ncbi:MAG: di-heme oxidoredictase family protein [Candidatus Thiodiazotropha sp. DIVDIV]
MKRHTTLINHSFITFFCFLLINSPVMANQHEIDISQHAFTHSISGLNSEQRVEFSIGKALFKRIWVSAPASTQATDGLGPLYNARSCLACHPNNGRGKPFEQSNAPSKSLVIKVDIPAKSEAHKQHLAENRINNIPEPVYGTQLQNFAIATHDSEFKLQITYLETAVTLFDGEVVVLRKPIYQLNNLNYGKLDLNTRISPRVAPQLVGLGLLEAIDENSLQAMSDEEDENDDGISGKVNWVWSREFNKVVAGKFGLKSGSPSINEQSQSAFFTDIGISTHLYPEGYGDCTNRQTDCRHAIDGNSQQYDNLEAPLAVTQSVKFYLQQLAPPPRRNWDDPDVQAGSSLFNQSGCSACHIASFEVEFNNQRQEIHPYTDLLLHDMGEGLADHRPEGRASGQEWRTPPLWGIGLTPHVSGHTQYLHDGRASTLLQAVLWHGGEAQAARDAVIALTKQQRKQLLLFLESI